MDSDKKCKENSSEAALADSSVFIGADEDSDLICDGKYTMVERGDQQRIILFKSDQTISFGKGPTQQDIILKGALRSPFLSAFKVSPAPSDVIANYNSRPVADSKSKSWKKTNKPKNLFILEKSTESVAKVISEFYQLPDSISSGTDNRNIVDDNTSQALKKQDIESLREQGVPSKEIFDTIITSSKSFGQKTEYAQEKYLRKKEKIYGEVLVFHKPSISILADYYYKKDPMKVLGLRPDTLSQILSFGNVHANGKYLIFENCGGLIVAAVLHRLGGLGTALHCHIGSNPQRQALVCMNFTDKDLEPMMNLDLLYLLRESKPTNVTKADEIIEKKKDDLEETSDEPIVKKQKLDDGEETEEKNGKNSIVEQPEEEESTFVTSKRLRQCNNKEDNERSLEYLNQTEFDGLIICSKEHPLTLFQRLVRSLALSTPFVIFCQYPEPLMDCYMWAKEKGIGCNVHLVDNWFRNIQVETERTHPEIQMSPSGGFLLYGTYTSLS